MNRVTAGPTRPRIEARTSPPSIRLQDAIENVQFSLLTPHDVSLSTCDADRFFFPVDTAAWADATTVEVPQLVAIWVRDTSGELIQDSTNRTDLSLGDGEYLLEVHSTPMKLYLLARGEVSITAGHDRKRVAVDGAAGMGIGVRSFHRRPAGTITTTRDPEDVMRAFSYLGSALKTTSCERSFPTLRGHPPRIELGESFDVPPGLERPETGVRIEVPPEYASIYPVATLAYYLGAEVVPGAEPRLVADGTSFSLVEHGGLEPTVKRVLEQVFLLDCVTRTEGYFDVDQHERRVVERAVDLDFADLYDRPLAAQVEAYLEVPYEAVEPAIPTWKLTADVVPEAEHVTTLPFLVDDLAVVRCDTFEAAPAEGFSTGVPREIAEFCRGGADARAAETPAADPRLISLADADSLEQAYVGEGFPVRAAKVSVRSFLRRLERAPTEGARIRVLVVCNDEAMREESVVTDLYGVRERLEFDVSIRQDVTTDEMADLLAREADFLHYIGHIDDEGIQCRDGALDAREVPEVNVGAFLLNACRSYQQGYALVERGALGGVVTLAEVLNEPATEIGRTFARLLNGGYSLLGALDVMEGQTLLGRHYAVVGDGNAAVVTSESGSPIHATVDRVGDRFDVTVRAYPSRNLDLGSAKVPYVPGNDTYYLNSGPMDTFELTPAELEDFLSLDVFPVDVDGGLAWSDQLQVSDL